MDDYSLLDFKVVREHWDVYELNDGTRLKNRVILTGVKKSKPGMGSKGQKDNNNNNQSNEYEFDFQSLQSFIFSGKSRGERHNNLYQKEELEASYTKDMPYSTVSEKWNEYVLSDDTKVKLKSTINEIKKSTIFLHNGDPIYNVKIRVLSKVTRPKGP
jgi:hypothetical protein